jgi:hypothetical protein
MPRVEVCELIEKREFPALACKLLLSQLGDRPTNAARFFLDEQDRNNDGVG